MMRSSAIHPSRGIALVMGLAVLLGAISSSMSSAQEGGVVAEFCKDDLYCADDTLEIVFDSGSSTYEGPVEPGVEVPIRVVLDTKSPDIQGYSWAVKHDGEVLSLIAESVSTVDTILDPENPETALKGEHFSVHRAVEGGFISAVVLSMREHATLPLGRNAICRAAYHIAATPECTVIRFLDRQLAAPGSPAVGINITTTGLSRIPRLFRHGLIRSGACAETCDDLADNDEDGLADCEDPECAADPICPRREICDDAIDNDEDGLMDCADAECRWQNPCVEVCEDLADNDRDGLIDCDDYDCWSLPSCQAPEVCDDGVDNDRDGLTDCDDYDCWSVSICQAPEVCDDGADNDRDGFRDCADPECEGRAVCIEVCDDAIDNDADGWVDCKDSDCPRRRSCAGREACDDGIDNDGDGFVDGVDSDCYAYDPVPEGAPPAGEIFYTALPGDVDGNGRVTVLDAIVLIQLVVSGEAPPFDCLAALNTNDDEGVNVADSLPIIRWIFLDGPALPGPFPECDVFFGGCKESSPGCS